MFLHYVQSQVFLCALSLKASLNMYWIVFGLKASQFAQSAHSLYRSLKLQVDAHSSHNYCTLGLKTSLIGYIVHELSYSFVHYVHSY